LCLAKGFKKVKWQPWMKKKKSFKSFGFQRKRKLGLRKIGKQKKIRDKVEI
jgi:hypothetical protein